ncbi:MAG: ribbon-helix-helix domain-containing protein [Candidatus Dormiibacterota bacterium]
MLVRTQIYLTTDQRARLAERCRQQGVPMAELVREAIDLLLGQEDDREATFGAAKGIRATIPDRSEW